MVQLGKNGIIRLVLKADCLILLTVFYQIEIFKISVGTTLSDLQGQEEGVPQGSILSVTLFSITINIIVKDLNQDVECSLYVDDFLICFRSQYMHII